MPSNGVILPAKYAGTNTPNSEITGPNTAANINGPGVIESGGIELEYTFIMPASQQIGADHSQHRAQDRADYAHRKTFQKQHAHDLFSRGADGPEDGKLPPAFAHVHQERVEDHENRQHDIQEEGEGQALLGVFQVSCDICMRAEGVRICSPAGNAAARSACTLFSSAPVSRTMLARLMPPVLE